MQRILPCSYSHPFSVQQLAEVRVFEGFKYIHTFIKMTHSLAIIGPKKLCNFSSEEKKKKEGAS